MLASRGRYWRQNWQNMFFWWVSCDWSLRLCILIYLCELLRTLVIKIYLCKLRNQFEISWSIYDTKLRMLFPVFVTWWWSIGSRLCSSSHWLHSTWSLCVVSVLLQQRKLCSGKAPDPLTHVPLLCNCANYFSITGLKHLCMWLE